jgi:spore coat protein U-like protein
MRPSSRSPAPSFFRAATLCICLGAGAGGALGQSCSITTPTGNYGLSYILYGNAIDAQANFSVTCTGQSNRTVRLCIEIGPGNNTDGSGNRVLASGANTMRHELYTSSARTTIWGAWGSLAVAYPPNAGVQRDLVLDSTGNGSVGFTIYGSILASQQTTPPGTYSWATSTPTVQYAYVGTSACPTGNKSAYIPANGHTWTATVPTHCIVSATALNFGSKGLLTTTTDATNDIAVACTNTTPYNVGLDGGTTGATDPTQRKMSAGAQTVTYGIYRDASHSLPWGNTVGTNTSSGTGSGLSTSYTGYGRVPAQTTPAPATYTDTVVVNVKY